MIGIEGAYDQVNRLCSEIAGKYGWGFVNVNLRPYYAEGSKSMGFEIAEQLGWKLPKHTVIPMASGSLLTKIHKAYKEFIRVGILDEQSFSVHGAQASGCSPISEAHKNTRISSSPYRTRIRSSNPSPSARRRTATTPSAA